MSMILGLTSLSDESLRSVTANPPLVWKILDPDGAGASDQTQEQKIPWFSKLFRRTPPVENSLSEDLGPVEQIDLDKAWHGIHYMLTKTAWEGDPPLNFLLLGGTEIGDIDVGYGTARGIPAAEVVRIHQALQPIDTAFLRSRFDPAEMMREEIYPTIWDRASEDDDVFGYCAEYFDDLKSFIARTADNQLAIIISIQ